MNLPFLTDQNPTYSFVIPVYNEEEVLPELHRRLVAVMDTLDGPAEAILGVDGSRRERRPRFGDWRGCGAPRCRFAGSTGTCGRNGRPLARGIRHCLRKAGSPDQRDLVQAAVVSAVLP